MSVAHIDKMTTISSNSRPIPVRHSFLRKKQQHKLCCARAKETQRDSIESDRDRLFKKITMINTDIGVGVSLNRGYRAKSKCWSKQTGKC